MHETFLQVSEHDEHEVVEICDDEAENRKPRTVLQCKKCDKYLKSIKAARSHAHVHSGVRVHECDVCGKRFKTKPNLREHASVHTGDLPFECEVCSHKFRLKGNLTKHYRSHKRELEKKKFIAAADKRFQAAFPRESNEEAGDGWDITDPEDSRMEEELIANLKAIKPREKFVPSPCDEVVRVKCDEYHSPTTVMMNRCRHPKPMRHLRKLGDYRDWPKNLNLNAETYISEVRKNLNLPFAEFMKKELRW